eukprot:3357440-Amphidinium_carterae.1
MCDKLLGQTLPDTRTLGTALPQTFVRKGLPQLAFKPAGSKHLPIVEDESGLQLTHWETLDALQGVLGSKVRAIRAEDW